MGVKREVSPYEFICTEAENCKYKGGCSHSYNHKANADKPDVHGACYTVKQRCQLMETWCKCRRTEPGEKYLPLDQIKVKRQVDTHEIPGVLK
jgi:hypothetical protein